MVHRNTKTFEHNANLFTRPRFPSKPKICQGADLFLRRAAAQRFDLLQYPSGYRLKVFKQNGVFTREVIAQMTGRHLRTIGNVLQRSINVPLRLDAVM